MHTCQNPDCLKNYNLALLLLKRRKCDRLRIAKLRKQRKTKEDVQKTKNSPSSDLNVI